MSSSIDRCWLTISPGGTCVSMPIITQDLPFCFHCTVCRRRYQAIVSMQCPAGGGSSAATEAEQPARRQATGRARRADRPPRFQGGAATSAGEASSGAVRAASARVGASHSSDFKGVSWHKHRKLWQVSMHPMTPSHCQESHPAIVCLQVESWHLP